MSEEALNIQYDDEPMEAAPAPVVEAESAPTPVDETQPEPVAANEPTDLPQEPAEPGDAEGKRLAPEFSPEQQAYINEHIVGRFRTRLTAAEEAAQEAQRQAQEYQQQVQPQTQVPDGGPVVPDMPEMWQDDYEEKLAERDAKIAERAQWEADQRVQQQMQEQQQISALQERQRQLDSTVAAYMQRAEKLNITRDELAFANNQINGAGGIADELRLFIAADEQGPEVTRYLGQNLGEITQIQNMSPLQAAAHIVGVVKPAIAAAKAAATQQQTQIPEPVASPKGSGVPHKERGPEGMKIKYE